jgi:nucleoside-diphosphate-sugar epimerase
MNKSSRIYVAGHRGLVGSAIYRRLQAEKYTNLIVRSHTELDLLRQAEVEAFFKAEKPGYVFLAAAKVGGICLSEPPDRNQRDSLRLFGGSEETSVSGELLHLSERVSAADEGRIPAFRQT